MKRGLHLGLACAVCAAAVGVETAAWAADGGGWPTGDAGGWPSGDAGGWPTSDASAAEGGATEAGVPWKCAYPDAGAADAGDGGLPMPSTMTPSALLAYYCGDADMQCTTSPVAWDKTIDLAPWLPDWDTGWIPQSFPQLQIRLILKIPADTQVKLAGDFKTTWPEALTLATPGSRQSGFLKFDYGLILSGRYKIDVTVLGYNIYYEEAIPYFPQVDFHLLGMKQFDSWAFAPNTASASAFTPMIKVFDFSVTDLVGIPSQVGDAGIRLNIKGELEATYETAKMVVEPSVAPILGQNATTLDNFKGGSFVEYDVHPEGAVTFDGVIHLIPSLYVSVLGSDFDLPLYDYPISMGDLYSKVTGQPASFLVQDFKFDKVRVHVPLPNIEPLETKVVDFGKVAIGSGDKLKIPLPNHGEGKAKAYGEVNDADKSVFKVMTQTLYIDPCGSEDITVRFTPKKAGQFKTTLTILSNDPDLPKQQIELRGEAVDGEGPSYPTDDAGNPILPGEDGGALGAESGDDGGCGCRVANSDISTAGVLGALGVAAMAAARRRRRDTMRII